MSDTLIVLRANSSLLRGGLFHDRYADHIARAGTAEDSRRMALGARLATRTSGNACQACRSTNMTRG